jgi:hypothetical protein
VNERTEFTPGGDVLACCWLSSRHSEEEFGDTLLAVAGRDNSVSIISVVSSAVVALLKGHTKARGPFCVSLVCARCLAACICMRYHTRYTLASSQLIHLR